MNVTDTDLKTNCGTKMGLWEEAEVIDEEPEEMYLNIDGSID